MAARSRQESLIELDVEFIRPRYTLVFSLSAVFLLIVLNVSFWYNYIEVIIWAIAASQLIRPLTDDFVRATKRLYQARVQTKRNLFRLFFEVVVNRDALEHAESSRVEVEKNSSSKTKAVAQFMAFVFTHPTIFLIMS